MVVEALETVLLAANVAALGYFLLTNGSYLLLLVLATVEFAHHLRRVPFAGHDEALENPLTIPVSVLVPAHDEQETIVESVQAMLALRYPEIEVVVVDDGSTDETFTRLRTAFDLVEVPRVVPSDVPTLGRVRSVHVPYEEARPLVVVRTDQAGKASALNTGVNVARYPLVCMVDADSILDPDALLHVARPFEEDPDRVVATGGVVRAANGCEVLAGRIVDFRFPRSMLARVQVVEYLRAFLLGRTGWSRLSMLLVISGAFGMFRRDVVVAVGGLATDCIGEDAELVARIHRYMRRERRLYRMVFVAEPVSWTEVPERLRPLARQRRRWHRGLTEVLLRYRGMLFNPRYGRMGLLAMPYYLFFELLAPVVELLGVVAVAAGWSLGIVDLRFVLLFLLVSYGFAIILSVAALAVEEFSFHRYRRWRDLGWGFLAAVLENLGYRQMTAVWRVQGMWAGLRGSRREWGSATRAGFATAQPDEASAGEPAASGR